jgi:DNA-binding CsgD family transcriptional regulator
VDLLLSAVHPDDRPRAVALMEEVLERPQDIPKQGIATEYRALRPDGSTRELRFRGRVEWRRGRATRWRASMQDVTEQRKLERELQAHYAIGQALRDWRSFDEGIVVLLRRLGTALDAHLASLWMPDPDEDVLRCRAFWAAPGTAAAGFEEASRAAAVPRGSGVAGRVWDDGSPATVPDLAAVLPSARRGAALAAGLRSGLAFPAVGATGVHAVLGFYTFDRRDPGERMLRTLDGIGHALGQFLDTRRAELAPRQLTVREREVLRLAAEGCSGPQIAERLGVSRATVKTHFEHLYEKLGVGDRAAAVAHALRTGLID